MFKKITWCACLFFAVNVIWGCMVAPYVPVVGTVYDGYVAWQGREAVKYYAEDIDTIRQAVLQSSRQLNLEIVRKSLEKDQKGYALEVKCNEPLQISILPFEKKVTKVIIKIIPFGERQFADFYYQMIDRNLAKNRPRKKSDSGWVSKYKF